MSKAKGKKVKQIKIDENKREEIKKKISEKKQMSQEK